MKYEPKPIDVSGISLPEDLLELKERIAENAHEIWAIGRVKEGWTYGPERNDVLKTNPNLVPYIELSEAEKEYDRNMAMDSIKLIMKMGYEINKAR